MTNTLTSQIGVYNSYSTNRAENPVVTVSINCVFMVKFTSRLALTLPCSSSDIPPVPAGHSSLHFPPRWPEVLFQTSLSVSMRGTFWRDQSRKLHYPYICLRQPNHLKVTGIPKPFNSSAWPHNTLTDLSTLSLRRSQELLSSQEPGLSLYLSYSLGCQGSPWTWGFPDFKVIFYNVVIIFSLHKYIFLVVVVTLMQTDALSSLYAKYKCTCVTIC